MDKMRKKVIIYGAGEFGKTLFYFLKQNGINVDFFCQSVMDERQMFMDIPIITPELLFDIEGDITILIAICDKETSLKIKSSLVNSFLDRIRIYECGSFIKENLQGDKYCLCCDSYVNDFMPEGISEDIFYKYHIIGGGYRENVKCPKCQCWDRERWGLYVLSNFTKIFVEKCRVLHFAAERNIKQRIQKNKACDYYSGDIVPGKHDHVVDVTDIQFKDNTFDYIIINHVLEHIEDEERAISELKRVLKKTGKLVISFPICTDIETLEKPQVKTREERLKLFGQEDHVRLYGIDYKENLEKYGLKVQVYTPQNECTQDQIDKYGFIQDDIMMICEKNV